MSRELLEEDVLDRNESKNKHFTEVLEAGLQSPSRRQILRGGVGLAAVSSLPALSGCAGGSEAALPALAPATRPLGFTALNKSLADAVVVPPGYTVRVLHATGDTIDPSVPAYSNQGTETDDWSRRIGDHHDGMDIFYIGTNGRYSPTATERAVLAVNHESSADAHFFHPQGQTSGGQTGKKFTQFGDWDVRARPGLEVLKEMNHHGVSVVELARDDRGIFSQVNLTSGLNRRVTAQTPCRIAGPAAHLPQIRQFMVTRYDTTGATARGTLNNCGHGITPWGTYIGCEENWAFYFNMPSGTASPDAKVSEGRRRYGVARTALSATATSATSQGWFTPTDLPDSGSSLSADEQFRFSRWNCAALGAGPENDFRNEPHTFGYNVEIDPLDPSSVPVKRTALGRRANEGCWSSIPVAGQPLAFYIGCDSRNEYIYKFVTSAAWDPADIGRGLAAGDKYLNEGKLYAAKFNSDGTGEWLELTIADPRIANYSSNGFTFASQADVYVFSRLAADAVGATPMDRPEWGAVNPSNGEVYFTLTNNNASNRSPDRTDAANPRSYADPAGRRGTGNPYGHIIRFKENGSFATGTMAAATRFQWDIFLFGAEADAGSQVNVSGLSPRNSFASPDGLWFSKASGILWIETDDGSMTDKTNNQLLAAIPGQVGDGGRLTIYNSLNNVERAQTTFVGGLLGEGRLRRFLVGVPGSEITGITETADGRTLYVNIQHPGENTRAKGASSDWTFESNWPANGGGLSSAHGTGSRPRSATLVITKDDGGVVGR